MAVIGRCRDRGVECDYEAKGADDDEVMKQMHEHCIKDHGMTEDQFTPEVIKAVYDSFKKTSASTSSTTTTASKSSSKK